MAIVQDRNPERRWQTAVTVLWRELCLATGYKSMMQDWSALR